MDSKVQPVLVPWDFSQIAEYALEHAVLIARTIGTEVSLVHIIKSKKALAEATGQLNEVAEKTHEKYNIKPNLIVREGSIFRTISDVVDEVDAFLVVMGTHGMKGMQKFTGSWALKVIAGSKSPFLVVQAPPKETSYNKIVFPVDFKLENKEKLKWANYLSKLYTSKILICKPAVTDAIMKKRTTSNLIFAKKFLDEREIDYEIATVEGEEGFAEETIKFAEKENASLILIMTTKRISFQDYVLGASEQQIIANPAKIPVMCVNPRTDLKKAGLFN